jgi:hypothetical protein
MRFFITGGAGLSPAIWSIGCSAQGTASLPTITYPPARSQFIDAAR